MAREIKFRFRIKNSPDVIENPGKIETRYFTLDELIWNQDFYDVNNILSKDQYVGLKDRNGKEIYEGDILKSLIEGVGSDKWIINMANLNWWTSPLGHALDNSWIKFEIIGNIYENLDLLK